ncbi:PAS domain S-box protein [Haloarcula sp. CBA1130]|uniref:hybrid sensor histidine kinase/response regulator n=1 Tax=unclassified Haloarcula TaxID=2624677 RepID=UPI0012486F6C|nr:MULTISPECIES: PAS domain S-box protein [unclassified Haloarcula]KAA9399992.1 PAS domain S-box protein [Haloarcula sp. CBA1129]KAA9402790.1 PAS domain S-box protein [Haloarcula sp. CBA1130]
MADTYATADSIHVLQVDDTPLLDEPVEFPDGESPDSLTLTTTDRADSALARLEDNTIDGIVAADDLPDRSGCAFVDAVRERDSNVPVLLLTESESVASDAVSNGVTDVFSRDTAVGCGDLLANRIRLLVEHHQSTETASRTRQRLTELTEQSNELLWVFSGDWTEIQFVNSAYETIYGRSVESLQANPAEFMTAIHPTDQDRVVQAMQRVSAGESVELEFRITRPDDDQRWVRAEAQPIVEDGTVTRIVGASRDITERKRRESERVAKRESPDAPVDAVPDLFYELDENGGLARWNDALAAATGYADADLAQMELAALFAPSDRENIRNRIETAFETGETSFEADLLTAGGSTVRYEFTGSRVPAADGSTPGVAGIGRDISDRDSRQQALERQNERLEEFASVVSHDLRNPLDVARGQLELAQRDHDSEHLDAIKRSHDRIGQLIEDLLTLAQNGEAALDNEPVPLQTIIEQCWQTVETGGATLELRTAAVIRADPSRLRQLFENLIRNSVEHGQTPHTERQEDTGEQRAATSTVQSQGAAADLTLTVGELDDGFYVADDGVGIPSDERETVFEGGYSLASGSGFGLRIVDEIVDTHGWSVAATESDDGGARFEITGVEFETV